MLLCIEPEYHHLLCPTKFRIVLLYLQSACSFKLLNCIAFHDKTSCISIFGSISIRLQGIKFKIAYSYQSPEKMELSKCTPRRYILSFLAIIYRTTIARRRDAVRRDKAWRATRGGVGCRVHPPKCIINVCFYIFSLLILYHKLESPGFDAEGPNTTRRDLLVWDLSACFNVTKGHSRQGEFPTRHIISPSMRRGRDSFFFQHGKEDSPSSPSFLLLT